MFTDRTSVPPASHSADRAAGGAPGRRTPGLRIRRTGLLGAAAGAVGIVVAAVVALLRPELSPFGGEMPGLLGLARGGAAVAQLVVGLLALAAAALAATLLGGRRPGTDLSSGGAGLARVLAGAAGLAAALTLPGSAVAGAGYLLAAGLLLAAPVALVALALRRPAIGVPLLAAAAIGLAAGELTGAFPVGGFLGLLLGGMGDAWLMLLATAAHTLAGLALLALAVPTPDTRAADAVRRARVPLTIAAAMCALPYIVARASWFTPWPLLGPSRETLDDSPLILVTGVLLGSAMVLGAVLTLGLVLPWGRRFPGWLPRVGGEPVPVALAVVPALLVAVLFTVGGIGMLDLGAAAEQAGSEPIDRLTMTLVLPFWLWGPLLALATWGYALDRRAR
jgi:hypothetical protein